MISASELVSVVIPAFNAAETLDDTLMSVRAQTHCALDIVLVDDGSCDGTRAIALKHAAEDPRIRVIAQENRGTAAARNRAIAEAKGALIAPIDADDLWRKDKIARQLQALDKAGPGTGLVYTWFAAIDRKGRVTSLDHRPLAEGHVLRQMCRHNLVGNGSAPLIPKRVLEEVGGYDSLQPHYCEDFRLYLKIAERYPFALVPGHLTGYRQTARSMSNHVIGMLEVYDKILREYRLRYPQYGEEFEAARAGMIRWLFRKAVKSGQAYGASVLFLAAMKMGRGLVGDLILDEAEDINAGVKVRIASTFMHGIATVTGANVGQLFLG